MEYKVVTGEKPSFLNKDAALGALLGLLIPVPGVSMVVGAAIGTAIGSLFGRSRMAREQEEGKSVKEPSLFNKKTVIGGLIGLIAGAATVSLAGAALAAVGIASGGAVPAGIFIAGEVLGGAYGALKGGSSGRAEMAREFNAAVQAQAHQDKLLSIARAKQLEQFANTPVLPPKAPAGAEVYAVPSASPQADGNDKSYAALILAERQQQQPAPAAAPQEKGPAASYTAAVTEQRNQPPTQTGLT